MSMKIYIKGSFEGFGRVKVRQIKEGTIIEENEWEYEAKAWTPSTTFTTSFTLDLSAQPKRHLLTCSGIDSIKVARKLLPR